MPFVVAGGWDKAARAFERVPKERLLLHRLSACVERCEAQFLERLGPPAGHQPPAHQDEFSSVELRDDDWHRIGRADIVAWLEIPLRQRPLLGEVVQLRNVVPLEIGRVAPTHARQYRQGLWGAKRNTAEWSRVACL